MDDNLLNIKELAQYLTMSVKWVEKHVLTGRLPGIVRLGRSIRFNKALIDKALKRKRLLLSEDAVKKEDIAPARRNGCKKLRDRVSAQIEMIKDLHEKLNKVPQHFKEKFGI